MKTFTLTFMVEDDVNRFTVADKIMNDAFEQFDEEIVGIVGEGHLEDVFMEEEK